MKTNRNLPLNTRFAFAVSGAVGGIIGNGLAFFLLIYYSQVLGLSSAMAGLAMMIALVFDAITDPLVGRWSDRLRHRWGRRHPFLFYSIIPIAVSYYMLWNPPQLNENGLFLYLVTFAVLVRVSLTAHNVPFSALLPEIAPEYDLRTRLINYTYCASWFIGTMMAVAMYAYWLADTPEYPDGAGVLRATGYAEAGLVGAVLILVACSYASWATTSHISELAEPPQKPDSISNLWHETIDTLRDKNYFAIIVSGIFSAAASGTATVLWAYMQPYFWGFNSEQTSYILASQLISAVIAFYILPLLTKGQEKKSLLIKVSYLSILVSTGPVFLALLGGFPVRGPEILFPIMLGVGVIQVTLIVIAGVLTASMIADIVESRAAVTGRREEGLIFSVQSFIGKASSGFGIWIAGIILAVVNFPNSNAGITTVDDATLSALGWVYGPALAVLYVVSIIALYFYHLDRSNHEENLRLISKQD